MRSLLRFCPICDAYEAIDQRIAVIGDGALAEREAQFLSTYSDHITLLHIGPPHSAPMGDGSGARSIERLTIQLSDLRIEEDRIVLYSAGERIASRYTPCSLAYDEPVPPANRRVGGR